MPQEKHDEIRGIGLILPMDKTLRPNNFEKSILGGSESSLDDFDNVMPEPRGSPLSEIIDPEMANWKPPTEKKRQRKRR